MVWCNFSTTDMNKGLKTLRKKKMVNGLPQFKSPSSNVKTAWWTHFHKRALGKLDKFFS